MSENMQKLMEILSKDAEAGKKAAELEKDDLIAFAAELGVELTEADFEVPEGELSENELNAVAGGGTCACVAGGGGTAGTNDKTCACVAVGTGDFLIMDENGKWYSTGTRCVCFLGGGGTSED